MRLFVLLGSACIQAGFYHERQESNLAALNHDEKQQANQTQWTRKETSSRPFSPPSYIRPAAFATSGRMARDAAIGKLENPNGLLSGSR